MNAKTICEFKRTMCKNKSTRRSSNRWTKSLFQDYLRNISNKRDSVSSRYPNTEKRVENTKCNEIHNRSVWIANETLSRVMYPLNRNKTKE